MEKFIEHPLLPNMKNYVTRSAQQDNNIMKDFGERLLINLSINSKRANVRNGFVRVLVTGSDGFIGSHLVEALVRKGYEVRAFVLYNSFNSWGWLDKSAPEIKEKFEIFQGDIRDPNGVKEAMRGCEAVLHLAALVAIPFSYHSPDTMYKRMSLEPLMYFKLLET